MDTKSIGVRLVTITVTIPLQTWKSVEEVDKNLMEMLNAQDYDMAEAFKADSSPPKTPTSPEGRKKIVDTENYYFEVDSSAFVENWCNICF